MKIKTLEDFKKDVHTLVGDEYSVVSSSYINNKTKLKIKHNLCGHIYEVTPHHFLEGKRCPYCAGKARYTADSYAAAIADIYKGDYTILTPYTNMHTNIKVKHSCGKEFEVNPASFLHQRAKCPCQYKLMKSTEEFKAEVKALVGDEYSIMSEYKGVRKPILIKHNTCGSVYKVYPDDFLAGHRCKCCCNAAQTKTTDQFKKEVYDLVGDEYKVISNYTGSKDYITFQHKDHTFQMRPNDFLSGHRCPVCSLNGTSELEKNIGAYITSLGIDIQTNVMFDKTYEADILIESQKLVIEVDGLYWHCDIYRDANYHINKTKFFNAKGYRVIHIFEDEWNNKQTITKEKLAYILHKANEEKIYARKCIIKTPSVFQKNEFLDKYHIQGADKAKYICGLYYNNKLVSIMTFIQPRISTGNKKGTAGYELSRYASSCNVIGGFSKLLAYAEKTYNITNIITYADLRWSSLNNNVYEKNGFTLSHCSQPNYFYTKDGKRYHRFSFRKQELKNKFPELYDENLTEFEIMNKTDYHRIYDCGNAVYIKK